MDPPTTIPVTRFFNLVLAWNRGVSFGLFRATGRRRPGSSPASRSRSALALALWLRKRREPAGWRPGSASIIGGALGNVIDRLRFGAVVDFLDFHWDSYHWPAFNLADSAITSGSACCSSTACLASSGNAKPGSDPRG